MWGGPFQQNRLVCLFVICSLRSCGSLQVPPPLHAVKELFAEVGFALAIFLVMCGIRRNSELGVKRPALKKFSI